MHARQVRDPCFTGRDSALQGTTRQGTTLQRCTLFVGRKRTSRSCVKVFAGKKGIGTYYYGYNDDALSKLQPECSWYMTWSSNSNNVAGTSTTANGGSMEFVPMIWGVKHGSASGDNRDIDREIANLDTTAGSVLLGYNEPDGDNLKSQSHIDVKTAADNWYKLERTGKYLGSPATAERATNDNSWMRRFMHEVQVRNLRVDFICLHWYPGPMTPMNDKDAAAQDLANYVTDVHKIWPDKQIWVTEIAYIDFNQHGNGTVYPDATLQREFAKTAVYKLENLACVDRYAWYALPDGDDGKNGLFDTSGKITDVGKAYKYAHG